ncbi:MAG: diaminopimelate epimerase [bacterium]
MKFTKMQGTGNHFIVIDAIKKEEKLTPEQIKSLCTPAFGIGADQLLMILPSRVADFRMRIFNADGGEVEMCGNGIRCVARYLIDHGYTKKQELEIETLAGIKKPMIRGNKIRVDMGEPIFDAKLIPVRLSGRVINRAVKVEDMEFKITCVSMGNPHTVIFMDKVDKFNVQKYGPAIENYKLFPKKTNVEFVEKINDNELKMRVWERGSGETLGCGSGACAAAVAGVLNNKSKEHVTIHLRGGDLEIEWAKDNHVYLTGPAEEVFRGEIDV